MAKQKSGDFGLYCMSIEEPRNYEAESDDKLITRDMLVYNYEFDSGLVICHVMYDLGGFFREGECILVLPACRINEINIYPYNAAKMNWHGINVDAVNRYMQEVSQ